MKQTIQFVTANLPLDRPGLWKITAQQQVAGNSLSGSFTFIERGIRYALPSNAVYEVFPPADAVGNFDEVLPHILLRGLDRMGDLCLLLLSEMDSFSIHQGSLGDFMHPSEGIHPLPLQPLPFLGETEQTVCTELMLSSSCLRAAVPPPSDRPFLGHLRVVATVEDKAVQTLEDGSLLCLFTNRPPRDENCKITVCLTLLPETFDLHDFPEDSQVLLPLLYHWSFQQTSGSLDFDTVAKGISTGFLGARESRVPLLQQGYLPVQHHLRGGGQTVSWYRGPLVPDAVESHPLPENVNLADAFTVYDPETGMLDISRSSAWQIGRLLALRSGRFTGAVQRIRTRRKRYMTAEQDRRQMARMFGEQLTALASEKSWAERLDDLCADCLEPVEKTVLPEDEQTLNLLDPVVWMLAASLGGEDQVFADDWLDQLCLLHELPFSYLVPEESMLPPESLRLFYLDAGWTAALREGALSVGRQCESDRLHDTVFLRQKQENAIQFGPQGFLLRSQMVRIWPGLEIQAYVHRDGTERAAPLRLEKLGEDTLIGIFDRGIERLEFLEPLEGLHISCEEERVYRDPVTGQPTDHTFLLSKRENGSIDFAATAARYPVDGSSMTPDLLALQLLQTAQKWIVLLKER